MTTIANFNALAAEQAEAPAVPYVFGGISLKGTPSPGVDCSGLIYAVARALGVTVPRTSETQFTDLPSVQESELRQGDLVLYSVPSDTQPQPAHVAIWWSPSEILQAPHTGEDVEFSAPLPYKIMGYRRLPFASAGASAPTPVVSEPSDDNEPTIQLGSTGAAVERAQQLLTAKFNHPLTIDGDFGPLTEAAVKDVQEFFKVTVDGVVGPVTWSILINL